MNALLKIQSCGKYKSFFQFIDNFWLAPRQHRVAHRICTVMRKLGAKTIIIERIQDSSVEGKNINVEKNAIETRLALTAVLNSYKFTFLQREIPETVTLNEQTNIEIDNAIKQNEILGYVVLVNVAVNENVLRSYIFESVVKELGYLESNEQTTRWKCLMGHYLHVRRDFDAEVLGRPYSLNGTFFVQQNGITSVCAHAALVMMLNNLRLTKNLVTTSDINNILKIDHRQDQMYVKFEGLNVENIGSARIGLGSSDLTKVLEDFGYDVHQQSYEGLMNPMFRQFIYGFIESGFPAILSFNTGMSAHVVTVCGHTLNSNSWLPFGIRAYATNGASSSAMKIEPPGQRYLSSLAWADDFLVNDDNVGMQLSLPAHAFHNVDHYVEKIQFSPTYAAGIFPKKYQVKLLSYQIEQYISQYLTRLIKFDNQYLTKSDNYYVTHLLRHFKADVRTVVLRTSLISSLAYIRHLGLGDSYDKHISEEKIQLIEKFLTLDRYWLVEVSEPDLYIGNKAKVIDILVDPVCESPSDSFPVKNWFMQAIRVLKFPTTFLSRNKNSSEFNGIELETSTYSPLYGINTRGDAHQIW